MFCPIVAKKFSLLKAEHQKIREEFKDSQLYTWVPYSGIDCDPPRNSEKLLKAYNHIEQDLVDSLDEARRIIEKNKTIATQKGK